jgi:DNA-binding PadR family transcriptional regulator
MDVKTSAQTRTVTGATASVEAPPQPSVKTHWEPRLRVKRITTHSKFLYFNTTLRLLALLAHAERKGYITLIDVRKLYSLNKRSRKAYGFLYNAVANGYFRRVGPRGRGDTAYTLTEKGAEALAVTREILGTPSKTGKRGKRTRKSGTR